MKLKIKDIIVKNRFRKDVGDLTTLKESIHDIGYYVKGAHELLLIGVKGCPGVPEEKIRIPSVVFAERETFQKIPDFL